MEGKYAGLPGIDTVSPDVFETSDEGVAKPEDHELTQEKFESEDIQAVTMDKNEAFNKFKGKYLDSDSSDFSGNIGKLKMRGYETRGEYEIIGDRSSTKETPGQKYQRLQVEMKELAQELEEIKDDAKSVEQQNKLSPANLAKEVKHLQQQLQSWQLDTLIGSEFSTGSTFPQGTVQKKLQHQLDTYKENSKSKSRNKEQVDDECVTYKLLYKPENAKLVQLSQVSELEERVKKLETLLGTDSPNLSTIFDQSVANERNLSAAISDVQDKLAVLDTTHVEHIDARLQGLLHHLDELSSKQAEQENVEKQKKISELYDLVSKWDATADVVPELIHRLETLKSLHDQANHFGSSLTHLDSTQTAIASQLQTQQKLLAKISEETSDLPANFTSSEHAMDSRLGSRSTHSSRLNTDRPNSEYIYTNGEIHHENIDDGRSRPDRSFHRTQQKAEEALHFSKQCRTGEILNGPTIPKFTMTLVEDETPLASASVNSGQTSPRQSETELPMRQFKAEISENIVPPSYESGHHKSREVASELKCSMCQREYSEPRLLPCLHSFCYRCLEEEVSHRSENRIRCPKCQKDFDLKRFLSVKGLPTNFVVTTLIDKAALERFELEPISCSSCEEKLPATVRCTDCMDYLCSTCHIAHHRLRLTKGHQILALQDIRRSKNVAELLHRPMFCSQHLQEKIRFYCESCDQAICRDCTMGSHSSRDHRYCSVSEAIQKQRLVIEQSVEKVRKREPLLRQAIRNVEEVNTRLTAKAQMAKTEINKCYPKLIKALEERHKFMLNEVDKMFHGKAKVLTFQQRGLEVDLENLLNTCKVTDDVLRHGNETEVLVVKKMLSDRLEELHSTKIRQDPEENDVVYFNAQEETMLKAIQTLGSVKVSSAYAALSCVVGGLKRVPHGKKSSFTVNTRDHYGTQCSDGGERLQVNIQSTAGDYTLAEVADNRDGSYTISFCPSKLGTHRVTVCIQNEHVQGSPFTVQVVQSGGMILKFGRKGMNMGEFNGIFGVAVDPVEGRIVVTDCHNHRVQVFSSDGVFLFHFGRKGEGSGEFQCPTGVAIDIRGQIIVCERLSYRLQVFSRDGSFLREYRIPDLKASTLAFGEGDQIVIADSANRCVHVVNMETGHSIKFGSFGDESGELSYPCYVAVNDRGHIVVSDMHSHKIQVFDSRGQFLFNFGKKGSMDGELLRPTGVAVSREGHIIVADRDNHRIQIFSGDGKYLQKFGCKGDGDGQLNDPHGLAITRDGSIVVADFRNNRVQVFGRIG